MDIFQKVSELEITEKTKSNILRKSNFIDDVVIANDGYPLPSWIDISLTELCNRVCEFCPRVDPDFYPNQNLHFSLSLASKLATELKSINYKGGVVFCGYGEPMLHPNIYEIVKIFEGIRVEIVSNGDKLNVENIKKLFDSGLSYIVVSLYDGPQQIEYFNNLFSTAGIDNKKFILRDRWHKEEDSFGLKLTNRGGVIKFGPEHNSFKTKPCYYTAYSMAIDWNGDVLLCVQDWSKKKKLGNISGQTISEIWKSIMMHKIRAKLINGERTFAPCLNCNVDGTVHGFNHVNAWQRLEFGI